MGKYFKTRNIGAVEMMSSRYKLACQARYCRKIPPTMGSEFMPIVAEIITHDSAFEDFILDVLS
jgi:hypothetical protein